MEDLYRSVVFELRRLSEVFDFQNIQKDILNEAAARLDVIFPDCINVIKENDTLLESDEKLKSIRELMTDERINEILSEHSKKDPKLASLLKTTGRLMRSNAEMVSAFDMNKIETNNVPDADRLKELNKNTERVYQSLWVIKLRLNNVRKFKSFNPPGVRDIRNHLIEHTDGANSGASTYSFGVATNGPVIRPMRPVGAKAPTDTGFQRNLRQFLLEIQKRAK